MKNVKLVSNLGPYPTSVFAFWLYSGVSERTSRTMYPSGSKGAIGSPIESPNASQEETRVVFRQTYKMVSLLPFLSGCCRLLDP